MWKSKYTCFLLTVSGICLGVNGAICPSQISACYCYYDHIGCKNLGLTSLPNFTGIIHYVHLHLDNNEITTITRGKLSSNLVSLSVLNNPVTTIDDSAFDGSAATLQELSLSSARFIRIPDAFLHLRALTKLAISNTSIQDWNVPAMQNIGLTLQNLELTKVGLTTWPSWIQYFYKLTRLVIEDSSISSISDNALDALVNTLVELQLIKNALMSIPNAFSQLKVLETLVLEYTGISEITSLASKVSTLTISNSNISISDHVSQALQPLADTLQFLDLQGNKLTSVPELSFLTNAVLINVDRNLISDYNSGHFPVNVSNLGLTVNSFTAIPPYFSTLHHLGVFDMSVNAIHELRGVDFPPIASLVNVSHNILTELTDTSFPTNSSIMYLVLDNNDIATISAHAFDNLPNLFVLNLKSTKLVRLPLALAVYDRVMDIDLTGNADLVCTCEEKSLEALFLMTAVNVVGDCGSVGIRDFFIDLSSACPA